MFFRIFGQVSPLFIPPPPPPQLRISSIYNVNLATCRADLGELLMHIGW
jgi:hypothetical protein